MTFPVIVRPGNRATAGLLNSGFLIGRAVFVAFRDAAQSITSTTVGETSNALAWDNVELNVLGGWAPGTPSRYTPPIAGRYGITGSASFVANGTGNVRGCSWRQNGSLPAGATFRNVYNTVPGSPVPTFDAIPLNLEFDGSSDYIELCPFQDGSGALNTATGSNRPSIRITYEGPL